MSTTHYVWDPVSDNVIEEYDETGATVAAYTAEPGLHGNVISQNRPDSGARYLQSDAIGCVRALTDSAGAKSDTKAYSAFGEVVQSSGTSTCPFVYVGRKGYYTDWQVATIAVRDRTYQPLVARWRSPDPLSERAKSDFTAHKPSAISEATYVYARNSPLTLVDPTGRLAYKEVEGPADPTTGMKPPAYSAGDCGEFAWYITWDLSETKDRFKDGFIVQRVEWRFRMYDCCDSPIQISGPCGVKRIGGSNTFVHIYYEIWRVRNGDEVYWDPNVETPVSRAEPYHDLFGWDGKQDSRGCFSKYGEAIFVTDLAGIIGLSSGGVANAGVLFSVCNLPAGIEWTNDFIKKRKGKLSKRVQEVEWNCCIEPHGKKDSHGAKNMLGNDCDKTRSK